MEKPPFNWGLAGRTLAAVLGLILVLFGLTELGIVLRGEGGRPALGAGVFLAGILLLSAVVAHGFRQAILARRRGEG